MWFQLLKIYASSWAVMSCSLQYRSQTPTAHSLEDRSSYTTAGSCSMLVACWVHYHSPYKCLPFKRLQSVAHLWLDTHREWCATRGRDWFCGSLKLRSLQHTVDHGFGLHYWSFFSCCLSSWAALIHPNIKTIFIFLPSTSTTSYVRYVPLIVTCDCAPSAHECIICRW